MEIQYYLTFDFNYLKKYLNGLPWCLSDKKIDLPLSGTWVISLDKEDLLEEEMVTHSMDSGASWATVHGVATSWTTLKLNNNNNNPQIAEIKKRSYTTDNI